jgi:ABC-2 type transport system ATP-binding protein
MSAKVVVRNLRKRYGGTEAASGVSFDIEEGEIFGLLGPNGAGKTTTVECVIGLRDPDEGEIEICGLDARQRPREVKQKIGAALQTTALQDKVTPREALSLFGAFYRKSSTPDTLLERFNLLPKADAPFDALSGGQRQRLALALAFVNQPELVFLDEPTAGLDPQSRRELHGEIERMKADGHTVLLTTHNMEEAAQLCDRLAIIDRGQIIATGAPGDLIATSSAMQSVSLLTAPPIDPGTLSDVAGLEDLTFDGPRVRFRTVQVHRTVAEVLTRLAAHHVDVTELHVQRATLEDVFLELTGTSLRD